MKYYGVSQSFHGHEYRYIFDEDTLSENIYDGNPVPDEDCTDCHFPIGGSNSSATWIKYLPDDASIKAFLTAPGDGPDLEDPTLVDIGEYLLTVSGEDGACTDSFIQAFGLSYAQLEQSDDSQNHKSRVKNMFRLLQAQGYDTLDYSNPFYGDNRDMRFSELCDLCDQRGLKVMAMTY
jgi:hypothetical protein